MAIFQYKIIVFQGKFSILSAFSIEKFERIRRLYCNLQYLRVVLYTSSFFWVQQFGVPARGYPGVEPDGGPQANVSESISTACTHR